MYSCSVPLTFTDVRDIHIKNICLVYRLRQLKLQDQFVPVDLFGITLLAVVINISVQLTLLVCSFMFH